MSTPKPGQIRCPTCLRSTPPAAFCTQCGSPIPHSARARPRGLDRDELEERVRRRPGEGGGFRRGGSADGPGGYVPFEPEPEDALAARAEEGEARRNLDNLRPEPDPERAPPPPPPDPDLTRPLDEPVSRSWAWEERPAEAAPPPPPPPPSAPDPEPERDAEPEPEPAWEPEPAHRFEDEVAEQRSPYPPEAYEDVPYGAPEDAYAYPYTPDDGRGGGGSALPIIGFVVLCVLALAVGAVLAGLLGGEEPVGQATPSPSVVASQAPSGAPSAPPSEAPSASAGESGPAATDGPITFSDGAVLTIQPCGSDEWREEAVGRPEEDACVVDGSSASDGEVWTFVVFNGASGDDELRVRLLRNDQVENELELTIDGALGGTCGDSCNGLIYGARYVELLPGAYRLELHRNGEFADSATFEVTG
jgi:hypothetical protein